MFIEKKLSVSDAKRILDVYTKYKIRQLPMIAEVVPGEYEFMLKFEHIEGEEVTEQHAPDVFSTLGKMHLECKTNGKLPHYPIDCDSGFVTVCHGDVHLKNVLRTNTGIRFIDAELLHIGCNYSDLDYVDFYDFYDPAEYPWMIHNTDCLGAYLDAIETVLSPTKLEDLKREIMINTLNKYISNGRKHNKDCNKEVRHLYELGSMPVIGL